MEVSLIIGCCECVLQTRFGASINCHHAGVAQAGLPTQQVTRFLRYLSGHELTRAF